MDFPYSFGEGIPVESYNFLFSVAIILLSTKLLGILTKRIAMPQVLRR